MSEKTGSASPRLRKNFGKKATSAEATEEAPLPAPVQPKVYVVYYYELKDGTTGISYATISGIFHMRTEEYVLQVVAYLLRENPDRTAVTIMNWIPLEG